MTADVRSSTLATRAALVASLSGLLFGFDTAVISGVERALQRLWALDGFWLGFTVAIALVGTVVGTIVASRPAARFGRKPTLVAVAVLYVASACGCATAWSWGWFVAARFIGGVGVGASSVVAPTYISEIAPAHRRGRLVGLFQINIVLGILLAFTSNWLLAGVGREPWRLMVGVAVVPSLALLVLSFAVPESPRWLVLRRRENAARRVLEELGEPVDASVEEIRASLAEAAAEPRVSLVARRYRRPVALAVALAVFNQLSGINALMYYAPRIFEMAGMGRERSLQQSVIIGVTNLVFTLLAMTAIDRVGRRTLLLVGSVGKAICLAVVAAAFAGAVGGSSVLAGLIGFQACFALSQGAVIWVFLSEIFPTSVRSAGQALGSFTHWIVAAIVSWTFPLVAETGRAGGMLAFAFFAAAMIAQLAFVRWFVPETRGRSLEQIERELAVG